MDITPTNKDKPLLIMKKTKTLKYNLNSVLIFPNNFQVKNWKIVQSAFREKCIIEKITPYKKCFLPSIWWTLLIPVTCIMLSKRKYAWTLSRSAKGLCPLQTGCSKIYAMWTIGHIYLVQKSALSIFIIITHDVRFFCLHYGIRVCIMWLTWVIKRHSAKKSSSTDKVDEE